ncbi:MAG: cobalt transport ATP-binding protein, cobalt/nickel transport system ATP-binding protein [Candidatus Gottesmanbacteria bacterium GW2011_GWA2_43_14]|uniref:Cobalt transport ATP-binding protein, cobalt/nickel transport system ATP-binding protein n=1 Tax=Candidatus Gottesmanbacteria bacterium GW2011_GWA2_43_14 TaxID=1618443 RepID=A0A0G1GIC2_9BACT|nr:MAG: cobalt transport ATP-binding protein, cobalt/nickel transport system ATP-binding protein [Candidatus Gottesmanbacteria bacterium GW2011_GWA2_43_14]
MKKILNLKNVSFSYSPERPVLSGINLEIPRGSFTGITGSNGSGKSTFLYLLNGLIPHLIPGLFEGDVFVDGQNTRQLKMGLLSQKVGLVFQNPDLAIFNLTVEEEIAFGLSNFGYKNISGKIRQALSTVGLPGFEKRDPQSLSFGEKQRVSLASILALDTDCLLLDEPTAMLDYQSSEALYLLLKKLNRQGKTIIVVEHDTDFLWKYAGDVLILHMGKIAAYGLIEKILTDRTLLSKTGVKNPHL